MTHSFSELQSEETRGELLDERCDAQCAADPLSAECATNCKRVEEGRAAISEDEIIRKMKICIKETRFQRQERVEKEFNLLEMGTMTHGRFKVMREDKLEDLEAAEVQMPDTDTLYRRYLGKLPQELKTAVTSRVWPLDGEDMPAMSSRSLVTPKMRTVPARWAAKVSPSPLTMTSTSPLNKANWALAPPS